MNRFKVTNENPITIGDEYIDLSQYLKNRPLFKIDNTLYTGPKIVKSKSGKHTFEIYEEIKIKKKKKRSVISLLKEIINKLDLLLSQKNI